MPKHLTMVVPNGTRYWRALSGPEVESLYEADRRAGVYMDSAGEPIVHNSMASGRIEGDHVCTVLRRRGISWTSWNRRPSGLAEVLIGLNRVLVRFSDLREA